jgi:hypothetical protein
MHADDVDADVDDDLVRRLLFSQHPGWPDDAYGDGSRG